MVEVIKRKGSKSIKDIPEDIMQQLQNGEIETANLVEWLAVDPKVLLANFLKITKRDEYLKPIIQNVDSLEKQTINTINQAIGVGLLAQTTRNKDSELLSLMAGHTSDCIRCWATYTIGKNDALSLDDKLRKIQPFAADKHFGVREISWLALRDDISKNLMTSLTILSSWTSHKDDNVRRFASEATRPRGVWCAHIEVLKEQPELGLVILEPLRSDPSKYVQDSVGNWLNDASKSNPIFVNDLCSKWQKESNTKETSYITQVSV